MTAPVLDSAQPLTEHLHKLGDAAARATTEKLAGRIDDASRTLTALWIREFGDLDARPADTHEAAAFVHSAVNTLIHAMDVELVDPAIVEQAWLAAHRLGVEQGLATASDTPDVIPHRDHSPTVILGRAVAEQAQQAAAAMDRTMVVDQGFMAVTNAVGRARYGVTRVDATVHVEVVKGATQGVRDVAQATGDHLIWVAERDACLHCLAYSGETTNSESFPQGLTFAEKPLAPQPHLAGPPLHPHCRCTLQCWVLTDESVVTSLQREAKRSVLRGDALDSEKARLRAAELLLARGAGLPKTVEQKAARAVREGRFPARKGS